jgi:hypothetical protein
MPSFVKAARREQVVKWVWLWFKQFSSFHRHRGKSNWEFSADHVIKFLQSKRDASVPAWKRMRVIEGLIMFQEEVQRRSSEDLVPLQAKMVDIIAIERAKNGGFNSIEGAAGVIEPNEPDAIQAFRRALRKARGRRLGGQPTLGLRGRSLSLGPLTPG